MKTSVKPKTTNESHAPERETSSPSGLAAGTLIRVRSFPLRLSKTYRLRELASA